jgi:hypothetical protein
MPRACLDALPQTGLKQWCGQQVQFAADVHHADVRRQLLNHAPKAFPGTEHN